MTDRVSKTEAEWRAALTPEQFRITREGATEPPFSGQYVETKDDGTYACIACGNELFSSTAKYDSGTGWPSFFEPTESDAVVTRPDNSHSMQRTEVLCARCGAHLGHVFDDGPAPSGERYCINSGALDLQPADAS